MKTSHIVIAAAFGLAGVAAMASPGNKSVTEVAGWIALACIALGGIFTAREALAERAARRREPVVREVPASTGIQVLDTSLSDEDGAQ